MYLLHIIHRVHEQIEKINIYFFLICHLRHISTYLYYQKSISNYTTAWLLASCTVTSLAGTTYKMQLKYSKPMFFIKAKSDSKSTLNSIFFHLNILNIFLNSIYLPTKFFCFGTCFFFPNNTDTYIFPVICQLF